MIFTCINNSDTGANRFGYGSTYMVDYCTKYKISIDTGVFSSNQISQRIKWMMVSELGVSDGKLR